MHVITFFRISFIIVGFFSAVDVRASGCPLVVNKNGAVNVTCTDASGHEKIGSASEEGVSKDAPFDAQAGLSPSHSLFPHGWHEQAREKDAVLKEKEHKNKELMDNLRAIP